jgi:hypothetical protein
MECDQTQAKGEIVQSLSDIRTCLCVIAAVCSATLTMLRTGRNLRCGALSTPPANHQGSNVLRSTVLRLAVCSLVLFAASSLYAQDVSSLDRQAHVSLRGSVGASLISNAMAGIERRRVPFSWMVQGSATLSLYGIDAPLSFTASETERSFQQPFNEFGISPRYKSVTVHAGYRSMSWSRYTNAGVRYLGAGIEVNPGNMVFAALYGRLQRAVEEDSSNRYAIPAYQRLGGGVRFDIGEPWLRVGLSLFYARDDSASLSRAPVGIAPMENATLGVRMSSVVSEHFIADVEVGSCFLTRDLRSPSLQAGGIPSHKMFVRVEKLRGILNLRTSSSLSFAGRAGLTMALPFMRLRLGFEVIEPEYTSFGAYYFSTDLQNLTIAPSFVLFAGRVRVDGSLGIQGDNVSHTRAATTSRFISSARVGWTPNQVWGIDASYSNYSTDQSASRIPLNDSIRVRNVSTSFALTPRLQFEAGSLRHITLLSVTRMEYDDLNAYTRRFTGARSVIASLSYTLAALSGQSSVGLSALHSDTRTSAGDNRTTGVHCSGALPLYQNLLRATLQVGYSRIDMAQAGSTGVVTEAVSLTYTPATADRLTFTLLGTQHGAGSRALPSYREMTATLGYTRSFDWGASETGILGAVPKLPATP